MEQNKFDLSPAAESKLLALEYMRQKSLSDDMPEDIAREYRAMQQKIQAVLEGSAV